MSPQAPDEFFDATDSEVPVRGYVHRPVSLAGDGLILTHGAGSNCQAPLLLSLADAFADAGLTVLRCDLPFRQVRPHGPPPRGAAQRDQSGLRAAVAALRKMVPGKVYLGGHSYGGRQASILAATEPDLVECLLLLSYPLHPPKRPAELRIQHLPSLRIPTFFVHGMRDGFGTISEMESALALVPARTELVPIEGAGHELLTRGNREDLIRSVTSRFLAFTQLIS